MLAVSAPDPADAHLLALVAEVGRVAVHDLARRAGMDAREVAARLAGLAASGLPLVVGVECDPTALRHALATWAPPAARRGGQPAHDRWYGPGFQVSQQPGPLPLPEPPRAAAGWPAAFGQGTGGFSAAWAGGDELVTPTVRTTPSSRRRTGAVGDSLPAEGPSGERLVITLVEVVDPADFLFTAAGHRLPPEQRSVVVHTEVTNRGDQPLSTAPDLYLVLLDGEAKAVSKAPVTLSSRPPHRVGVQPGETAGGHTVFVLPEAAELAAVRWSPGPDAESGALTWTVRG